MSDTLERRKTSVLRVYARYTRRYPWLFFAILMSAFVTQGMMLLGPLYWRDFVNILVEGDTGAVPELVSVLGMMIFVWVCTWAAERARYFSTIHIEAKVMPDLMRGAFTHLIDHSYNFFVTQFAGSLTHRVNKFSRAYETLFDSIIVSFVPTSLFVVGAIVILTTQSPILGIVLLIWTLLFLVFQYFVSLVRRPARAARARAETQVTASLADAISNQATITLFSGGKHETHRFFRAVDEWRRATLRSWSTDAWIWAGIGLFIIGIEAVMFYVGIRLWERDLFTAGDFVLVQAYLFTAFERLAAVNREMRRVSDSFSDAAEMIEILDKTHEIYDVEDAMPLDVEKGKIRFSNVTFNFNTEKKMFDNLSLTIEGGEKVALVGPSGAGKSTLTKLILRLFNLNGGSIEIDGQNIATVTQKSLRNSIAFVPQEPILFHRTLMENIRYGRLEASDQEVIDAAKKAHCHEFIDAFPQKYDTYVGERGVKLSGGERQRIAIARAILKNAPILMLDEATSSLDSASEVLIQDALATLMQDKTVLVIAHRLSTIMKMDRIITLVDGRVVEDGSHHELVKKGGVYAELWSHQAGGFLQA